MIEAVWFLLHLFIPSAKYFSAAEEREEGVFLFNREVVAVAANKFLLCVCSKRGFGEHS